MKLVQFQLFSQAYFDGFTYNLKYSRYLKLDCECNEEIPNTICKLYNSETLLLECRSVTSTDIGNLIKLQHLGVPKDGIAIRQATKSANAGSLRNQGPENVSSLEEVSDATSYLRRSDLMAAELLAYEVKDFFKGKDAILKLEFEELFKAKRMRTIMWQQDSSDDHTLKFSRLEKLEEWSFIEGGVLPRLKNLCFEDCHKLKMTLLGDYFPSLTELVVINCEELIPLILPRAQLMQAPLITLKKIAFRIDSEFYYSTSVDSSAAIQAKPFFRSLETLKFLDMKKFEEWSFIKGGVFPRLKNLYFQSCLRLKVTFLDKLEEWSFIEGGVFPRLKKLRIESCHYLRCLPKELPASLSDLHINYCQLLRSRFEEWSFIEGGVFPRLKNLQLRGCERLKVTLLADYFPSLTDLEI
ncbi:hypothetical protein G4B88_009796, partial [Cannabis sativa]